MALSKATNDLAERWWNVGGERIVLYAPNDYLYLSRAERDAICNGCGPRSWKFDIVPDTIYGLSIKEVCNIHDYMYHIGTTQQDKWFADALFLLNGCLLIMNVSANAIMKTLRVSRMAKYYLAVALAGNAAFATGRKGVHTIK
jgi:hypothetical protein